MQCSDSLYNIGDNMMSTPQVKIFKDSYYNRLEQEINQWLTKFGGAITIHDIKYSTCSGGSNSSDQYSALIYYTTNEKYNEPIQLK